jgi:hypothetical protein
MKKRLLTLIVAVASVFTAQLALTSPAQAATKKNHNKKHHKHMNKTADAGVATPAA